ncbi:uncharacterized protein LOC111362308 [Spodoptera litura]|uniref:Uncharacterized protein LOC111362308 n=1 Tax=Spodoptera litura TaxID=69820 RepID=A0A9J7J4J7_SPOLT|nr:uncharacterized protein LOC111362308 [Spodoptera litura]
MYYNLSNYWTGVQRITTYLNGLNELCHKTDPRYCKTTLEQLNHEMEILEYYNTVLLAPHKHLGDRKKRGLIDGIGYVANSLFGVLDQRFADKYQKDIQAIQNNENYLLELLKNQTSIVELQNQVLKKNEQNIQRQFALIDVFMNETDSSLAKVESEIEIMMATSYFNTASLTAYLLITNLNRIQEMLFKTLTDVYKGHIDVHLITPTNLIEQLSEIASKLPSTSYLPVKNIREDLKDLYKLLYMRARVTNYYFLFEVHVPLIADEDFTLYKAIPLPMKINTETTIVLMSAQYIAVNFRKNSYVSLNEDDLKLCFPLQLGKLICNKNLPIFNLYNNNAPCEAKLLSHQTTSPCDVQRTSCKEEWIPLHTANAWLAICCGTCTLRTVCEKDVTSHSMTTGIVNLAEGCSLQSKELTIHSHNQYNSHMKMDFKINVPTLNSMINNIINKTYHNRSRVVFNMDEDLDKIDKQIATLQKREEQLPTTVTNHDIHQYAISYTIVGIMIIGTLWWVVKRFGPTCGIRQTENRPATNHVQFEGIELKPIPRRPQEEPTSSRSQSEQRTEHPRRGPEANDNLAFNFD